MASVRKARAARAAAHKGADVEKSPLTPRVSSTPPRPAGTDADWFMSSYLQRQRETFEVRTIEFLRTWRRGKPFGFCPLPELFRGVAEPAGMSIGQFHDALRYMLEQELLRLHPFTGAAYQIQQADEAYWLVSGQEIKAYAELLGYLP